jgi:hypothetical protein
MLNGQAHGEDYRVSEVAWLEANGAGGAGGMKAGMMTLTPGLFVETDSK